MKNLTIYPSFLCPFSCQYCLFKNKLSLNETLDLNLLKTYLYNNQNFDTITISGGDPLSLSQSYMSSLLDILKTYNKPITLSAYPYKKDIPNNINYDFSYDFLTKPRATEAWEELLRMNKDFKLTITLSPLMFKYHPNNIFQKLALLPHLKEVEFIPYCKNECNQFDITKNDTLTTFIKMVISTKLNLPFKITNKENIQKILLESYEPTSELCLFPNGKTYHKCFENDILVFKESNEYKVLKYPQSIDIYNPTIVEWFKNNGL